MWVGLVPWKYERASRGGNGIVSIFPLINANEHENSLSLSVCIPSLLKSIAQEEEE